MELVGMRMWKTGLGKWIDMSRCGGPKTGSAKEEEMPYECCTTYLCNARDCEDPDGMEVVGVRMGRTGGRGQIIMSRCGDPKTGSAKEQEMPYECCTTYPCLARDCEGWYGGGWGEDVEGMRGK